MRRAFASLVLAVGLLCGWLTLAGWWMRHTVMEPTRTTEVADAIVGSPALRTEVADQIGAQLGPRLGVAPDAVAGLANTALQSSEVVPLLADLLRQAHERLIGEVQGPVVLDPTIAARLIGDQRAAQLPAVAFDVPTVEPLDTARRSIDGVLVAGLVLAVGLTLSGFVMHPSKPAALRTIGIWLICASVLQLLIGYIVPVVIVPRVWDNPWADLMAEVAKAATSGLVAVLVVLAAGGVVALLVAASWRPLAWAGRR